MQFAGSLVSVRAGAAWERLVDAVGAVEPVAPAPTDDAQEEEATTEADEVVDELAEEDEPEDATGDDAAVTDTPPTGPAV